MRIEGATHRATDRRGVMKTFELLSIIGSIVAVGITLGAVMIGSNANLHAELRTEMQTLRAEVRTDITDVRTEMQTLRAEVSTEMQTLRTEVRADITDVRTEMQTLRTEMRTDIADVRTDIRALEHRLAGVEQRQARTEGLLEGLRDAIMATRPQAPPAQKEST